MAPDAQVIAIRAFTGEGRPDGAQGTSFHILQGLDFAAMQRARIVNMSFAGPQDALLSRALSALRARGVTEVAAAGNGGPRSAPLFPGADAGVIAVTATDAEGQLFGLANHGTYIAMAAPGVDILAPAPGDTVQIVSGTSIAAAHVTGIAALALERYGSLAPDALLGALDAGSRKLSPEAKPEIMVQASSMPMAWFRASLVRTMRRPPALLGRRLAENEAGFIVLLDKWRLFSEKIILS